MLDNITNCDIVIVGQQPWDVKIGSNCKNIALELSKYNRVLYVNCPLDRITAIRSRRDPDVQKRKRVIDGHEPGLIHLHDNLWTLYPDCLVESVNRVPVPSLFNVINRRNGKKFSASIKRALRSLNFSDIILFNDNEIIKCFYLKELLKPTLSIYYSRDMIVATEYWRRHGPRLEPSVINSSDLCVANSTYLQSYCAKYNPASYYIGQGCELEIFQREHFQQPGDLSGLASPIIGYVGAIIAMRLDIEIIRHIATVRPDWTIVLVGPEDEEFRRSDLHNLKNVIFTGAKVPEILPDYISMFDVCINPQLFNPLTIGNYPRKIDEYLAMGKPVVATATTAMETFAAHVYLAADKHEYVALISKAMEFNSPALAVERKAFANMHTWQNSVREIYKAIATVSDNQKEVTSTVLHEPDTTIQ